MVKLTPWKFLQLSLFVEIIRYIFAGKRRIIWKLHINSVQKSHAFTKSACYSTEFLEWNHVAGTGGIPLRSSKFFDLLPGILPQVTRRKKLSKQSRVLRLKRRNTPVKIVVSLMYGTIPFYLLGDFLPVVDHGSLEWSGIFVGKTILWLLFLASLTAFFCLIGLLMFSPQGEEKRNQKSWLKRGPAGLFCREISDCCHFVKFPPEFPAESAFLPPSRKNTLAFGLQQAIKNEEFDVVYQPICDLTNGRKTAFEALLRCNHPQLGVVYSGEFIRIAEEERSIIPLGKWVLRRVCRDLRYFLDKGYPPFPVSVNISSVQLEDDHLAETIASLLKEYGLQSENLVLELTESGALQGPIILNTIRQLQQMGIGLALDDFGTGYSTYSNLKDLPVDSLKIDRSLISGISSNTKDAIIVHSMVHMAHALEMKVVAEGIESFEQFEILRKSGCDWGQGYFLGRPASRDNIEQLLNTEECLRVSCQGSLNSIGPVFRPEPVRLP